MAEVIDTAPHPAVALAREATAAKPHISWGAIFGGVFASLGLWLLLYVFGLAIGLSRLDPNDPGTLKSSGIFTGIWGLVSPLVALFVGGFIAGRTAGVPSRGEGAVHGLVMWGLSTVAGMALIAMALAAAVSGVVSAGKAVVEAGGQAAASSAGAAGGAAQWLGLNADDALRPINERLRAEGKPEVTAAQLQATLREVGQNALRTGGIDRDQLVESIARNTALSRADAQEIADRVEAQVDRARAQASSKIQDAEQGAMAAAKQSGKAFWGAFGAMLLGLVAALIGGALGVPSYERDLRRRRAVVVPASGPGGVPLQPREAHP